MKRDAPLRCIVCHQRPLVTDGHSSRLLCRPCAVSYDRSLAAESTIMGIMIWAAQRARRFARAEVRRAMKIRRRP